MTASGHGAPHKNVLFPILMTCLGYACYNLSDAGAKALVTELHFSQVMLISGGMMVIFMGFYGWLRDGAKAFRTDKPKLVLARALLAQVNAFCNLLAFPHIQLTTFYTLVFTSPFWVALISAYFFKEKLDGKRLGVILFGFAVILFIFRPGGAALDIWSLMILFSAFTYSWQLLVVRKIGSGESRAFMYICGSVMSMIAAVPFLGAHSVEISAHQWLLFVGITLISGTGLLCISYAFQEAPSASSVAPFHYTQIIWGALLGYYLFSEVPKVEMLIGAGLLIASGLYLMRHEHRKSKGMLTDLRPFRLRPLRIRKSIRLPAFLRSRARP